MDKVFEIRRYVQADKAAWDAYVAQSRNGTFLFYRDYMDYHADRFADHSLLFFCSGKLYALLPAHGVGNVLYSHSGLTYGGLIMQGAVTAADTCRLFEALNDYLRAEGFAHVVYRPVPWIYHQLPAEEDLYAIFWKCKARLSSRNISSVIDLRQPIRWRKDHRQTLKRALSAGVTVRRDASLSDFWPLLEQTLQARHGAVPVHTLAEIALLKSRLPSEIVQYSAYNKDGNIVGGITCYLTPQVAHVQYSAANEEGRACGATEAIYDAVLKADGIDHYRYLDFGTSNEQGGSVLNEGLIGHKEGYGARGVAYDTYEWDL